MSEQEKLVQGYLASYREEDPEYEWAYSEVHRHMVDDNPERALDLVIALLQEAKNNDEILYISGGPLEELLENNIVDLKRRSFEYMELDRQRAL